jgi:hypothetical protein
MRKSGEKGVFRWSNALLKPDFINIRRRKHSCSCDTLHLPWFSAVRFSNAR